MSYAPESPFEKPPRLTVGNGEVLGTVGKALRARMLGKMGQVAASDVVEADTFKIALSPEEIRLKEKRENIDTLMEEIEKTVEQASALPEKFEIYFSLAEMAPQIGRRAEPYFEKIIEMVEELLPDQEGSSRYALILGERTLCRLMENRALVGELYQRASQIAFFRLPSWDQSTAAVRLVRESEQGREVSKKDIDAIIEAGKEADSCVAIKMFLALSKLKDLTLDERVSSFIDNAKLKLGNTRDGKSDLEMKNLILDRQREIGDYSGLSVLLQQTNNPEKLLEAASDLSVPEEYRLRFLERLERGLPGLYKYRTGRDFLDRLLALAPLEVEFSQEQLALPEDMEEVLLQDGAPRSGAERLFMAALIAKQYGHPDENRYALEAMNQLELISEEYDPTGKAEALIALIAYRADKGSDVSAIVAEVRDEILYMANLSFQTIVVEQLIRCLTRYAPKALVVCMPLITKVIEESYTLPGSKNTQRFANLAADAMKGVEKLYQEVS